MPKADKILREHLAKLGRKGGIARAKTLTAEQRAASARKAARIRWAKVRRKKVFA